VGVAGGDDDRADDADDRGSFPDAAGVDDDSGDGNFEQGGYGNSSFFVACRSLFDTLRSSL
jgi:hypothetical protein